MCRPIELNQGGHMNTHGHSQLRLTISTLPWQLRALGEVGLACACKRVQNIWTLAICRFVMVALSDGSLVDASGGSEEPEPAVTLAPLMLVCRCCAVLARLHAAWHNPGIRDAGASQLCLVVSKIPSSDRSRGPPGAGRLAGLCQPAWASWITCTTAVTR